MLHNVKYSERNKICYSIYTLGMGNLTTNDVIRDKLTIIMIDISLKYILLFLIALSLCPSCLVRLVNSSLIFINWQVYWYISPSYQSKSRPCRPGSGLIFFYITYKNGYLIWDTICTEKIKYVIWFLWANIIYLPPLIGNMRGKSL